MIALNVGVLGSHWRMNHWRLVARPATLLQQRARYKIETPPTVFGAQICKHTSFLTGLYAHNAGTSCPASFDVHKRMTQRQIWFTPLCAESL